MADLLVRLYDLPPLAPHIEALSAAGVTVRRALPAERHLVVDWVRGHVVGAGSAGWADECDVAFARQPLACFVAVEGAPSAPQALIGFACYEATCRNFFGPAAVKPDRRRRGVGRALLLAALHAMRAEGYAYAIIGGVGPADFYAKTVNATEIPNSTPGIYTDLLKKTNEV